MASKNTFYFSHDGGARNDDKMITVRMKHKAEGYAVYFMILEKMLESSNYILARDYNVLAFDFRVGSDLVKSIVEDFGLFQFTDDEKSFFSKSFQSRMKPLEESRNKSQARSARGNLIKYKHFTKEQVSKMTDEEALNALKSLKNSLNLLKDSSKEQNFSQSKVKESIYNNTNVLLKKNKQKKNFENSNFEETQNSTSLKNSEEEKEKSSAKKEKELKDLKNFLIEKGADDQDVSEWFKKRIEENKPTKRYFVEKFTLECKKNNISVKDAVYACAFNGWVNFNPQWILNQQNSNSKTSKNGSKEANNPNDPKIGRENLSAYEKLYKQIAGE